MYSIFYLCVCLQVSREGWRDGSAVKGWAHNQNIRVSSDNQPGLQQQEASLKAYFPHENDKTLHAHLNYSRTGKQ